MIILALFTAMIMSEDACLQSDLKPVFVWRGSPRQCSNKHHSTLSFQPVAFKLYNISTFELLLVFTKGATPKSTHYYMSC